MARYKLPKLGKLGSHPEGKIHQEDEGALRLAVFPEKVKGVVIVQFGTQVTWLGLPPPEARALGKAIIEAADKLTS